MRFNYKIERASKLEGKALREKILLWLNKADYNLIAQNDESISFDLRGWGSNGKQFDKVNGGRFEIIDSGEERIIRFSYYLTFTFELFFISLLTVMSFFKGGPFLFLLIALILILLVRHFMAKAKCQEVLEVIAAEIPLHQREVQKE
ncbi:hypothetical protein HDC90_001619 [Pedobacter sp. AK013]|uniref:hypothetical protein n=1 Tax=Pedobacter sp. AK013 TaxID=2723071 RepID=UPI00161327FA|nr:hypothetical protein [Pedobacter sp. AK013]MBB6237002.1 hypothetical protein [Pedobacter sp. AK013]